MTDTLVSHYINWIIHRFNIQDTCMYPMYVWDILKESKVIENMDYAQKERSEPHKSITFSEIQKEQHDQKN